LKGKKKRLKFFTKNARFAHLTNLAQLMSNRMNNLKHNKPNAHFLSITKKQLVMALLYGVAVTFIVIATASWF